MAIEFPTVTIRGLPSFQLYRRTCIVTVGTRQIVNIGDGSGLNVSFSIKRTLKPNEPNTCDLQIWGLSEDTRKELDSQSVKVAGSTKSTKFPGVVVSATKAIPVRIDAGYVGHMSTLFLGELRFSQDSMSGAEYILDLSSGDKDSSLITQRANVTMAPGDGVLKAVPQLLNALGVGQGNFQSAAMQKVFASSTLYSKGVCLKGNAGQILRDLCTSVGLEFSVQGGQAQFVVIGQPIGGDAYELNDGQGLVGASPTVDTEGILSFQMLMAPGVDPGKPIVLDSRFVKGAFRILSVETSGNTRDGGALGWTHKVEAGRYGIAP